MAQSLTDYDRSKTQQESVAHLSHRYGHPATSSLNFKLQIDAVGCAYDKFLRNEKASSAFLYHEICSNNHKVTAYRKAAQLRDFPKQATEAAKQAKAAAGHTLETTFQEGEIHSIDVKLY